MFSGLLFCADCGSKMQFQRKGDERTDAYVCGNYRRNASNGPCTTHHIQRRVLKELVLADLQRVLNHVKGQEREFAKKAAEYGDREAQKALAAQRRELEKAGARLNELNALFRKLYEDNALKRISDVQFATLAAGFEDEKAALAVRASALEQALGAAQSRKINTGKFLQLVRRYTDLRELTYENLHDFIDRIVIHATDKETKTRRIEIFYSFVGQVQGGESVRTEQYARRLGGVVESIAI